MAYRGLFESYLAANLTYTIREPCMVFGVGLNGETLVRCDTQSQNEFERTAGLFEHGITIFHVLDGAIIEWVDGLTSNDPGDFYGDFWAWFHETHPNEAQAIGTPTEDVFEVMESAVAVAILLEYVNEFVAQSDVYPVGG